MEREDGESWPFPSGGQPQIPAVVWEMMSYSLETWLRSFGVNRETFQEFQQDLKYVIFFFPPLFFINIVLDYVLFFFFPF